MKSKKLLILVLAVIFAVLVFPSKLNIVKADDSCLFITIDENGEKVLVDNDGYKHYFFTTSGEPVDPEDYLKYYSSQTIEEETYDDTPLIARAAPNSFKITGSSTILGNRVKVTQDYKGPATITTAYSKTFNDSFTISLSTSLKAKFKIEVSASLGVSWTTSASSTTTISGSYDVPSGKIGAIYFTPYYLKVNAIYYDSDFNATYFTAKTPKTLSGGVADGLFELVY